MSAIKIRFNIFHIPTYIQSHFDPCKNSFANLFDIYSILEENFQ